MRVCIKRLIIFLIVFTLTFSPVLASGKMKVIGSVNENFTLQNQDLPKEISFILTETRKVKEGIEIPEGAKVTLEIVNARRELRWHVSGLILCKLKSYTIQDSDDIVDLSDKEIYLVVRKYEVMNTKEASILATEIILTQAAGIVGSCFIFFAPVDIAYFFTKGAIKREKHPNWFRAGVMDAYDNSIFWFQLKGKPIELEENQTVSVKEISEKKAKNLDKKITNEPIEKEMLKGQDHKEHIEEVQNKEINNINTTENKDDINNNSQENISNIQNEEESMNKGKIHIKPRESYLKEKMMKLLMLFACFQLEDLFN